MGAGEVEFICQSGLGGAHNRDVARIAMLETQGMPHLGTDQWTVIRVVPGTALRARMVIERVLVNNVPSDDS
jgi:hypothetical protein